MFLLWALVCSLSRITDHRHHWWDVVAGSVVGVVSALYTVRMFCDDFCSRHDDGSDDSLSSNPKGPSRPLLNGHVPVLGQGKECGMVPCSCPCPDTVPARRLLSSSSSCASSLTAEERELREVSTTS